MGNLKDLTAMFAVDLPKENLIKRAGRFVICSRNKYFLLTIIVINNPSTARYILRLALLWNLTLATKKQG